MKEAVCMYLGGMSIQAEDSDYDSCRDLGIICPICHEALFLVRRGSHSYFSHYKLNESFDPQICEKRVMSTAEKFKLSKHNNICRNQRLDLYNKKLFELIFNNCWISKQELSQFKKALKKKPSSISEADLKIIWKRKYYQIISKSEIIKSIRERLKYLKSLKNEKKYSNMNRDKLKKDIKYLSKISRNSLHVKICTEIFQYLNTNSSNLFWKRMHPLMILLLFKFIQEKEHLDLSIGDIHDLSFRFMMKLICGISWIEEIKNYFSSSDFKSPI